MPKRRKQHEKRNKPDSKWFKTRLKEMGLSVQDVAKRFKTHRNMVWRMMSGERAVRPGEIITWSEILDVPLAAMMTRFGFSVPSHRVRVVGAVRSNGRVSMFPPGEQSRTEAPTDSTVDTRALVVESPQSALAIWDGYYLYYEPSNVVRPDAFGRLSVIELGDHEASIVGVLDRGSIGRSRIIVFGGEERIESTQLVSATPIRWQRAG